MRKVLFFLLLTLTSMSSKAQLWYKGYYKEYNGGMSGIYLVQPVVYSPDGRNCYIGSYNGLTWYDVDVVNANLTYRGTLTDGSLAGGDGISDGHAICISPDGRYVYLAAGYMENSITLFSRNTVTGELTYVSIVRDGDMGITNLKYPYGLAMDKQGKNLYASCKDWDGNSLIWFSINSATGALTYMGKYVDDAGGVDGLQSADNASISADGLNVYVTAYGDDALTWYRRDTANGNLTYGGMLKDNTGGVDGLDNPYWVAISPDGKFVYASGQDDNSIAWFSRRTTDGAPTYVDRVVDGVHLSGVRALCFHPSGNWLVASASYGSEVAWYAVNKTTGALTYAGHVKNGEGGVAGIGGTRYNGFSPDGSFFIATGYDDNGVTWFRWAADASGVPGISQLPEIKIYPDPVRRTINFLGLISGGQYELSICNINGAVVYSGPVSESMNCPPVMCNGVYCYRITETTTGGMQCGTFTVQQ